MTGAVVTAVVEVLLIVGCAVWLLRSGNLDELTRDGLDELERERSYRRAARRTLTSTERDRIARARRDVTGRG